MSVRDELADRRTSADIVYDALYDDIVSLDILPGTKISEADTARRFGLSRQPVREAFSRLSKMGLVVVRPQRSTVVRHFSLTEIENARFIRAAIELAVLRRACDARDPTFDAPLRRNMKDQRRAIDADDASAFHRLDYVFHRLLCRSARAGFAFETISANKAQLDRLCVLSLTTRDAMEALHADHTSILDGIMTKSRSQVEKAIHRHLDRLTPVIETIYRTHRDYFEA